jgi:Transposase DDE domain.
LLYLPDFIAQHRTTPKAFSRTRKLPFQTLCLFLLNLIKGSLQDELDGFFQVLNGTEIDERVVTKSALSQARHYLSPTVFSALSDHFLEQYYQSTEIKKWRGFRLLAVDGSTVRLPDNIAIREYFGGQHNGSVFSAHARLSECYDVLNHMTLDLQIAPYDSSERDLAALYLKKTHDNDLILYDRGYPAFWLFALHRHYSREFCMRVPVNLFSQIEAFTLSNRKDQVIEIHATKEAKIKCRQLNISDSPIKLRFIKVILSTGEMEILVTTLLDKDAFEYEIFMELYHFRWGVEEDYKRQKSRFEIENFSGLTVHAIKQDILAKMFMKNITMAVVALAQPSVDDKCKNRKHVYQINVTQSVSKMKHFIIKFFKATNPKILFQKLVDICSLCLEPIRKGRSYTRKPNKSAKRFHVNYKRAR